MWQVQNDVSMACEQEPLPEKMPEKDEFEEFPDGPQLRHIMESENPQEPFGCERQSPNRKHGEDRVPTTLREALEMDGCMFNALFRLALKLRSLKGGMDSGFLPNPKNARRASNGLNWYQQLASRVGW